MALISRIAILTGVCALYWPWSVPAYPQDSLSPSQEPCAAHPTQSDNSPTVDVSIADVSFWGADLQLPSSEQNEIAAKVESNAYGSSVNDVTDKALELVREGWQDHGYFQVRVTGDTKTISSNAVSQRISVTVHVVEGLQYKLQGITFRHNKVFYSKVLRSLFPIEAGEVVERQKMAKGLENLKRAYDSQGFINYTPIPAPSFDETSGLMSWEIDIDEGRQFYVRDFKVLGLDDATTQGILNTFLLKRGDLYNQHLVKLSLEQRGLNIPECPCRGMLDVDERHGTVDIALDFNPCNQ